MAANDNICIGPLSSSLHLQLSVPGREKPCQFLQFCVIWLLFVLWHCGLGSPAWGVDPTLLGGSHQLLKYSSSTSAAACGSPASSLTSPLHSVPIMLWWSCFFCLSVVIRLLNCCCSIVYSGWFLHNVVIIPDWSWEEVSVSSTPSTAILGFYSIFYLCCLVGCKPQTLS